MTEQIIRIHRDAPTKPEFGAACNGCGVCCLVESCPVSRFFLLERQGPCRALVWSEAAGRYGCGMMEAPAHHVRWLPSFLGGGVAWLVRGWLAAGEGCDSDSVLLG